MKRFFWTFLIAVLVCTALTLMTGCSVKQREMSAEDSAIAASQSASKIDCYQAMKDSKPDMSGWSSDKVIAYSAMEKLGQANLVIAGKSVDPCADAGGTNVYDSEIGIARADAEVKKSQSSFFKDVLNKGLIALGIWKFADAVESGGFGGSRMEISGEGNSGTATISRTSTEEWAGGGLGEGATGGQTGGGGLADIPATSTPLSTDGGSFTLE